MPVEPAGGNTYNHAAAWPGGRSSMLQIRSEQMLAFQREPRQRFERELALYLTRHFPFEAAHADVPRWVRTAVQDASRHGFWTRHESALYLALTAMLGSGFAEDPQIPWAANALANRRESSVDRLTRLYDRAIEFLDATGGPKCSWLVRAKIRVRRQDMRVLDRGIHPRALPGRIRDLLVRLYPQKAAVVGQRALTDVAKMAIARVEARGATSAEATLIQAVHMYFLGSGFERDPCYPWTAALDDDAGGPMDRRYATMHERSLEYLDRSFQFKE
jgi:hypothetical protein